MVWLLVEYVEENNAFPSYDIVRVSKFSYPEKDLQPGKMIFISLKQNNVPRQVKIIKTSDDKQQIKEHKFLLERQDQQIKSVLQVCMRTIKEIKSDQVESGSFQHTNTPGKNTNHSHVIAVSHENSDSDDDDEEETPRMRKSKFSNQSHRTNESVELKRNKKIIKDRKSPFIQRNRSIITSTPLPGNGIVKETLLLSFDQGTQTEENWTSPATAAKIEELEMVLKHLYSRFQSMLMKVNNNDTNSIRTEENGDVSYYVEIEQNRNDAWVPPINIVQNEEVGNNVESECANNIDGNSVVEPKDTEDCSVSKVAVKQEMNGKNENSRVRRMSAQTTYSNEMVPIGNGHAMVPSRLLNEIDWQSHTTATRQLLQAIFPRKVLATHSLTGKQSPAHRNKPAKQLLDPNLVNDIVMIVSSKSGVSKNLVRNTITVKCTDEAKLYKNRLQYRFSRAEKKHHNDENVPPSLANSSDESGAV